MVSSDDFLLKDIGDLSPQKHQLIFVYGYRDQLENQLDLDKIKRVFPAAEIVTISTAGHFHKNKFAEEITINAIHFEHTKVKSFVKKFDTNQEIQHKELIASIPEENLRSLYVISDNSYPYITDLIAHLNSEFKGKYEIFGGLAGNLNLKETSITGLNETPSENNIVIIGFYGKKLKINTEKLITSRGFGLDLTVSKSNKNELIELNGKPAYDVLYELLRSSSPEFFESRLMTFPFLVKSNNKTRYVRSPIQIDHKSKRIYYGGDFRDGEKVQLTRYNVMDGLESSQKIGSEMASHNPELTFVISCYGRRLLMNELINEEVEYLNRGFNKENKITGFYSYAEFLTDHKKENICEIHNNSIALVSFSES